MWHEGLKIPHTDWYVQVLRKLDVEKRNSIGKTKLDSIIYTNGRKKMLLEHQQIKSQYNTTVSKEIKIKIEDEVTL